MIPKIDNNLSLVRTSLENSESLLKESRLLLEHHFFARSISLGMLGSEELGKILYCFDLLLMGCITRKEAKPKKLTDHLNKIAYIHRFDFISTIDGNSDQNEWREYLDEKNTKKANLIKNRSLYVDLSEDGTIFSPLNLFSEDSARALADLTWKRFDAIKDFTEFFLNLLKSLFDTNGLRTVLKNCSTSDEIANQVLELNPEEMLSALPVTFLSNFPNLIYVFDKTRSENPLLQTSEGSIRAKDHPTYLRFVKLAKNKS